MEELSLTVTRRIEAPRARVFEAWLDPRLLARFMRTPSSSAGLATVENDPVKGGTFRIVMPTPEKDVPHTGTYLEIDRHARLAFTWASPHSLDDSVVMIDFAELGPEATEISLSQVKFRNEGARDGHEKGWTAIIDELARLL